MQLLGAPQFNFSVSKLHFKIGDGGLGGIAVRLRGIESPLVVGVVQCCEQLVFFDAGPLVKKNRRHSPRDFCGDGGPPPRRHVAAGIQRGLRSAGVGFGYRCRLDDRLLIAQSECGSDDRPEKNNRNERRKRLVCAWRTCRAGRPGFAGSPGLVLENLADSPSALRLLPHTRAKELIHGRRCLNTTDYE